MRTVRLLRDMYKKENDVETFQMQLLDNKIPVQLSSSNTLRVVIANGNVALIDKKATIVNAAEGIIEFTVSEQIGNGLFDCEIILLDEDVQLTFPERHYQTLIIAQSLANRPNGDITETMFQTLDNRIASLEGIKANTTYVTELLANKSDVGHTHTLSELTDLNYLTTEEVITIWNKTKE